MRDDVTRYALDLLSGLHHLLYPPRCLLCNAPLAITDTPSSLCAACHRTLPRGESSLQLTRLSVHAPCLFVPPISDQIHRFKYPPSGLAGLDPAPRQLLSYLLTDAAGRVETSPPDAIIPVPLHRRRLRQRGFNPAALLALDLTRDLARHLARDRGPLFLPSALERTRDTPSQTGLGRAARRINVKGAFDYRGKPPTPRSAWLIDDVVTTGATLEAAACALRKAGVREVAALCVASTPLDRGR